MNVYVPLKIALERNRFKEVVCGVLSVFESSPLNAPEIIQLGELALIAIERDESTKHHQRLILKKLAIAYATLEKHAQAKRIYLKLLEKDESWEDLYGLLTSLANEGEIEELKKYLSHKVEKIKFEKNIIQLKKIANLLSEFKILKPLEEEITFKVYCLEGNVRAALKVKGSQGFDPDFIRDVVWQLDESTASAIALEAIENENISDQLIIKKIYESFMVLGESHSLLEVLIKYYLRSDSKHIGYFFKENSGLKVELSDAKWIEDAFKRSLSVEAPPEFDVELDLGEDLFSDNSRDEHSLFKDIKAIENRISFLLNHNKKDEAKRLNKELLILDPSNIKFQSKFKEKKENKRDIESTSSHWMAALDTLKEIDTHSLGHSKDLVKEMKFSWKQISNEQLIENYREYSYALILADENQSCVNLLEKTISLDVGAFKDASYLKARCFLKLERFGEARAVAESIIESCVLDDFELNELQYLCAEAFEAQGKNKDALSLLKAIEKRDPSYRLVASKLLKLEHR